jgi:Fe-S cluster assembly ATPase SufC
VSGGEKKRVTTGEMLVGNQRFMAMDEISTGAQALALMSSAWRCALRQSATSSSLAGRI